MCPAIYGWDLASTGVCAEYVRNFAECVAGQGLRLGLGLRRVAPMMRRLASSS